ncbi:hypothetical protein IJ843_01765 [bacterium]|nr:hypothetical protein [bacterium]
MSEDMSVSSLLNDYASGAASFIRGNASASNAAANLSAAFSSGSGNSANESTTVQTMSDSQILNELRLDGSSSLMTARQVADEYNISLARAQDILDKLNGTDAENVYSAQTYNVSSDLTNDYSYSVEDVSSLENTTVSYVV